MQEGMHNAVEAPKRLERRFPFPVASGHEDNGPEFTIYAMAKMQGGRKGVAASIDAAKKYSDFSAEI